MSQDCPNAEYGTECLLTAEIERLRQALHDARIENSGQAAELERLSAERRWIPVEERLPELGDEVLVVLAGSHLREVAWRSVDNEEWLAYSTLGDVTHWMPLPPPPLPGKEVQA